MINLEGFKSIDLSNTAGYNRVADPSIKISDKMITFNSQFCRQLHFSKYVDVLINTEHKQVAFVARDKPTKTSRRFHQSKNETSTKHVVYWTGKEIRHAMDVIFQRKAGDTLRLIGEGQMNDVVVINQNN